MTQYTVDAFTGELFCGNPAAINILDRWPEKALMMKITRENNLSETAFAVPEGEGLHLRFPHLCPQAGRAGGSGVRLRPLPHRPLLGRTAGAGGHPRLPGLPPDGGAVLPPGGGAGLFGGKGRPLRKSRAFCVKPRFFPKDPEKPGDFPRFLLKKHPM